MYDKNTYAFCGATSGGPSQTGSSPHRPSRLAPAHVFLTLRTFGCHVFRNLDFQRISARDETAYFAMTLLQAPRFAIWAKIDGSPNNQALAATPSVAASI